MAHMSDEQNERHRQRNVVENMSVARREAENERHRMDHMSDEQNERHRQRNVVANMSAAQVAAKRSANQVANM